MKRVILLLALLCVVTAAPLHTAERFDFFASLPICLRFWCGEQKKLVDCKCINTIDTNNASTSETPAIDLGYPGAYYSPEPSPESSPEILPIPHAPNIDCLKCKVVGGPYCAGCSNEILPCSGEGCKSSENLFDIRQLLNQRNVGTPKMP